MQLHAIDFIVVLLYFAGVLAVGFYFSDSQSQAGFFLGDRRMPWFLVGISVIATLLSTVSYLATPGEMIRYGTGILASTASTLIVIPAVNYLIIPFLMRLQVSSVYEHLEQRFSLSTRLVAATTFILSRLIWTGLIIYMTAVAISAMTGWSVPLLIIVIGVITTLYTSMGGIKAVLWTDFFQFAILFGGALFVPCYIGFVTGGGPAEWLETFSAAGRTEIPLVSFDPAVRLTVLGLIVADVTWNLCTHGADQVAAQRYLSTPSAAAARRSVWIFGISNVAMTFILGLVGVALFYYYQIQSTLPLQEFQTEIARNADQVFPNFIASSLPAGVAGLMIAAILSAAMSSLSSGINSISTVAMRDFIGRFRRHAAESEGLAAARWLGVSVGAAGIGFALGTARLMQVVDWNFIDLMMRLNHLFVAPLGVLFFAGFLLPKAGSRAALGGFAAGVATSVSISLGKELYGLERPISFLWNMPLSFLVSFAVTWLLPYLQASTKARSAK